MDSGNYIIDANPKDSIPPYKVYCDMSTSPATTSIAVANGHRQIIEKCDPASTTDYCAFRDITYDGVSKRQLNFLVDSSERAHMQIIYESLSTEEATLIPMIGPRYENQLEPISGNCQCGKHDACSDPSTYITHTSVILG